MLPDFRAFFSGHFTFPHRSTVNSRLLLLLISAFVLGCIGPVAYALPSDKEQEIRIAANTATLDQRKGVTIYSGDVQFSQGSLVLKADTVIAHFNADTQKIEKIEAHGSPARYQQQPEINKGVMVIEAKSVVALFDNDTQKIGKIEALGSPARFEQQPSLDKGVITAKAENINYLPDHQRLLLVNNASLEQDGASMNANEITYDLLKEVMQAAGNTQSEQQRIEIIIPPQTTP
jgi:lipopolysaccharide export system protein LptA